MEGVWGPVINYGGGGGGYNTGWGGGRASEVLPLQKAGGGQKKF